MSTEVGTAFVSIIPSAKGFQGRLTQQLAPAGERAGKESGSRFTRSFSSRMTQLGPSADRAGKEFGGRFSSGFSSRMGALRSGLVGALAGVAVGGFLRDAIGQASDLNESMSKVGVVFGKSAGEVESFARGAARNLGQSQQQALEAAGTFGNLFTALKIGPKSAAGMSTSLVKLAGDLASFNNVDPAQALDALRSGLTGETEPLKRFGVNMNDATLHTEALRLGLIKHRKDALTPAAKAQAAYALILDQTKTAQGDFGRTSGGLANQQRILAAQFTDLKARLGQQLLPAAVGVASFFTGTLLPALGRVGGFIRDTIGPVFSRVKAGVDVFFRAFAGRTEVNELGSRMQTVSNIAIAVRGVVSNFVDFIRTRWVPAFRSVASFVQTNVVPVLAALGRFIGGVLVPVALRIAGVFAGVLQRGFALLSAKIAQNRPQLEQIGHLLVQVGTFIATKVLPIVARFAGFLAGNLFKAVGVAIDVIGGIVTAVDKIVASVRTAIEWIGRLIDKIKHIPRPHLPGAGFISDGFNKLTGRATGGPVNARQPYIVGENGPELFISKYRGQILPHGQVADAIRGLTPPGATTTGRFDAGSAGASPRTLIVHARTNASPMDIADEATRRALLGVW